MSIPSEQLADAPSVVENPDDEEARIAREDVPGYAGLTRDAHGAMVLHLADTSHAAAKIASLQRAVTARAARHAGAVGRAADPAPAVSVQRVRAVRYDFNELDQYRDVIAQRGLGAVAWTMLDVNEGENRVTVGVARADAVGDARAALRQLGIPQDAFDVEVVPELRVGATARAGLRSPQRMVCVEGDPTCNPCDANPNAIECRPDEDPNASPPQTQCFGIQCAQYPPVGGVAISYVHFPTNTLRACAIGALVEHRVSSWRGFLTSSHCSAWRRGTQDYTRFRIGYWLPGTSPDEIGIKANGPAYRPNSCFAGYLCRDADVQFAEVHSYMYNHWSNGFGWIARPVFTNNPDPQQAPVLASLQGFRIVRERRIPMAILPQGAAVAKVGPSTGLTTGVVINTCYHVGVGYDEAGNHLALKCQYRVGPNFGMTTRIHAEGDSGGPVFTTVSGTDVTLEGMLVSGDVQANTYTFSAWFGIRSELLAGSTSYHLNTVRP